MTRWRNSAGLFALLGFALGRASFATFGRLMSRDLSQRRVKALLRLITFERAGGVDKCFPLTPNRRVLHLDHYGQPIRGRANV
jgi:hypothetical protein